MSELFARLREIFAALAASDPACKRFGAAAHRYELLPPVTDIELAHIEERVQAPLPDDYLDYITRFSRGGLGPYYGLLPADRAAAFVITAPPKRAGAPAVTWQRALPLAHLGCGYSAVMPLDGPNTGQIWLDARQLELVELIHPTFTAFLLDWVDRLASNQWLEGFVPVGRCPLQAALSAYLHVCEEQLGLADGQLAGDALRDALAGLGPDSIVIAAEGSLFADGDNVDPCITCARMLENLRDQGLPAGVVAPGMPPRPAR